MKRTYSTGVSEVNSVFIGNEVEKTQFHGLKTQFVTLDKETFPLTIRQVDEIEHIYLGANHTYDKKKALMLIQNIRDLDRGLKITVEVPCEHIKDLIDFTYGDDLCITVSLKIPHIEQTRGIHIKVDDIDFDKTNRGVWVAPVEDIMKYGNFTKWDAYKEDILL